MKIDKRLNLVLEVERADGTTAFVHSTPISRGVYDAHFLFINETLIKLYEKGFQSPSACSRMGHRMMRKLIEDTRQTDNAGRPQPHPSEVMLNEIWRLTNVALPGPRGYEQVTFYDAMNNPALMNEDDVSEVQEALCYFTCASWVHTRAELAGLYEMMGMCGLQTTPLDFTDYVRSLPMPTPAANTGATATV